MKRICTTLPLFILLLNLLAFTAFGQKQSKAAIAQRYINENTSKWNLAPEDVTNLKISDQYFSGHNGVTHLFFNQQYNDISIYNAVTGIHISTADKVVYATNGFMANLATTINTTTPTISAYEAITFAAQNVGANLTESLRLISQTGTQAYTYEGGNISNSEIKVKLIFQPISQTKELKLAWHLYIDQVDAADIWSIRVDATNGEILDRNNLTLYCNFSDNEHQHGQTCVDDFIPVTKATAQNFNLGETYNILAFPAESPIHGDRTIVTSPSDDIASPFGWHDTDGNEGAEHEITRGNNVHAYLDIDENNESPGGEPEGGTDLTFDFPFDQTLEPSGYQDAAVTQLFYAVNAIHDFTFHYGFDEAAGNFQVRNYSGAGQSGDHVRAEGQDGSGINNANFSTPSDGNRPRMQMFVWDAVGGELLSVLAPVEIAGGYETGTATYEPFITDEPIIGTIIDAYDASNTPSLGCETIINAAEVNGNIAMIDRGECFFLEKTLNAEAAGAIALIICNFEENANTMNAPSGGGFDDPTIPTVSLKRSTCELFRQLLSEGVMVQIVLPENSGPTNLDACFDNGVIAHEFGHGISNRLTGGPSLDGCLGNDEQMGEGWSDFFTLVQTVELDDAAEDKRGIGNYLTRSGVTGGGIRNLPYTTDFNINNHTYDDIISTGSSPHALGEVWATMLWDLHWAFVAEYGFDEDLVSGTGGNNMAVQLVMDGMKLQGCLPGFVSGRDGILNADLILNNGANQCLIWEVFARRGLGYFADEGDTDNRFDGVENFDVMPACIKTLKIAKEVTPLINAGDQISVTLTITNHKEEGVTGMVVSDELAAGSAYIAGTSSTVEPTINGNLISFEAGELAAGASMEISYALSTDADAPSISAFYDGMENGSNNWFIDAFDDEGFHIWDITSTDAYTGEKSWFVENAEESNDQVVYFADPMPVTGTQPVLRFYHKYNTQHGIDGGFVQISTDGGSEWDYVDALLFKNGYRGGLAYPTFAIPNLNAFWGISDGFVDSYVDLSDYIGEDIIVRFRFGSNDNNGEAEQGIGWYVDDVELLDMVNYNGEACVNVTEGDEACAVAVSKGSIVEVDRITTSTDDPVFESDIRLFPNPAAEKLTVSFAPKRSADVSFELISTEGRVVFTHQQFFGEGKQNVTLNIANIPTGFYFVKISSENEIFTRKLIIE